MGDSENVFLDACNKRQANGQKKQKIRNRLRIQTVRAAKGRECGRTGEVRACRFCVGFEEVSGGW